MPSPDYYLILGIDADASQETIKTAFRRLALKYHPDKNPGSAEAIEIFTAIHKAYEVLSHPEKRKAYDVSRGIKQHTTAPLPVRRTVVDKSKIRLTVDRRVVRLDEPLRVTVSVYEPNANVALGGMSRFELLEGPSVNSLFPPGKNNPELEITYVLKPKMPGYAEMGPAQFVANGIKYLSETLNIKVNPTPDLIVYRPVSRMEKFQGFTYVTLVTFYTILIAVNIWQYKIYPFTRDPKPHTASAPVLLGYTQLATGAAPFEKYFGQGRYDSGSHHRIVFHNDKMRDAVVLLMDAHTNEPVRNNYIRAGDDLVMGSIPDGDYYLKALFGNDWNEELCISENETVRGGFNRHVRYENFQQEVNLLKMQQSRSGDTLDYKIYEITLYPVQDGNVESVPAEAGKFFGE